ncbi:hypothetical protein [Bacillus sp. LL01]|uniref:hypothetical protein n=1 Tax=Bacillus sp. LL01 TaxID=1665556 RepID=UPI000B0F5405|nr:hypothetical protein [Bacillus sp. LL01]
MGKLNVPFSLVTNYVISITCSNPGSGADSFGQTSSYSIGRTNEVRNLQASSSSDCGCGGGLTSSNPNWGSEL